MTMVEFLISLGGRRWAKRADLDRVYLPVNVCCEAMGLQISYYNSGNVSAAKLRGERISNSHARELLQGFDGAYYDVPSARFVGCYAEIIADLRGRFDALSTETVAS